MAVIRVQIALPWKSWARVNAPKPPTRTSCPCAKSSTLVLRYTITNPTLTSAYRLAGTSCPISSCGIDHLR